jgi:O-antigen ligase
MAQSFPTSWWDSKLLRRVEWLALAAAMLLVFRIAWLEDLDWVWGVLVCAVIVLVTSVRWPTGALIVLVAMSAMPVYFVELFRWKARPEHFASVIVFSAVCAFLFFSKQSLALRKAIPHHKLDYWVYGFIAINFVSSAVGSTAPASTLRWALQNSLAVLPYFLIRYLIRDLRALRKAYRILLTVGLAECVFGIFCYLSHYFFNTTFGVTAGQYFVDVAAPYGSMYEANLFGAYAAGTAVLFLAIYLAGQHRLLSSLGFLIAASATALSYSRSALGALVVVSVWVFWRQRNSEGGRRVKFIAATLAIVIVFSVAMSAVGGVLQERFKDLYYQGLTEETTISRVVVLQEALFEIPSHPILGTGTASFNLSFDWGRFIPQWASDKTWIGNAPLRILHDTGLVGLTIFFGFFFSVWRKTRLILKGIASPDSMVLGLVAGTLVYALCFQLTDGTILAFCWVHLGFLASAAILYKDAPAAAQGSRT